MSAPVGIFDSGLGGLGVAAQVLKLLPNERIVYFADTAHVPYGERPLTQIAGFAADITDFLMDCGAKAVVMACNMSSAVALQDARARYPDTPIFGVIGPGARAALEVCGAGPVGVLATTGTVNREAYVRAIERLDPSVRVVQQACPRFVPLVECGRAEGEEAEAAASDYVAPLLRAGCRTILLGCTHYPFLRRTIRAVVGPDVAIVDPAEETARALQNSLLEQRLQSDTPDDSHSFYASGDISGFSDPGSAFLGWRIEAVRRVRWGVDVGKALRLQLSVGEVADS